MSDPSPDARSPVVVALARDLMFVGRLVAEARSVGVPMIIVREPAKLTEAASAALLLVDLNLPGAIPAFVAWRASRGGTPAPVVVGFVAHTDATTIATARAAGIDRVLARSAFVAQLPALLDETVARHRRLQPDANTD
jgi:DNA-binding NarL/FixJ family response regulator